MWNYEAKIWFNQSQGRKCGSTWISLSITIVPTNSRWNLKPKLESDHHRLQWQADVPQQTELIGWLACLSTFPVLAVLDQDTVICSFPHDVYNFYLELALMNSIRSWYFSFSFASRERMPHSECGLRTNTSFIKKKTCIRWMAYLVITTAFRWLVIYKC